MKHKIILAELEKTLFPDFFPFYSDHFQEDEHYLKEKKKREETSVTNIAFKVKVVRASLKAKDKEVRQALNHLFNIHVETFYDWRFAYNWYELKSILCFFLVFADAETFSELRQAFRNPRIQRIMRKYSPIINQLENGKHEL